MCKKQCEVIASPTSPGLAYTPQRSLSRASKISRFGVTYGQYCFNHSAFPRADQWFLSIAGIDGSRLILRPIPWLFIRQARKQRKTGSFMSSATTVFIHIHDKEPQDSGSGFRFSAMLHARQDTEILAVYADEDRAMAAAEDYVFETWA